MPLYRPENVDAPVLSQFSLKGKVAAVTGGARGIGLEVVRGLAEAGASVALIYTTSSSAPETAAKISKETGSQVCWRGCGQVKPTSTQQHLLVEKNC